MLADKPTELSRIKLHNLNWTARPYDQRAFRPFHPSVGWLSHLDLATYMSVVSSDALAQASDFRIERRQVVFRCWMQDSNAGSQTPNRQQTEWPLTNRLNYRGSSYKTRKPVPMISEHSAHSTPLPVAHTSTQLIGLGQHDLYSIPTSKQACLLDVVRWLHS